jgi:hypothetical protein
MNWLALYSSPAQDSNGSCSRGRSIQAPLRKRIRSLYNGIYSRKDHQGTMAVIPVPVFTTDKSSHSREYVTFGVCKRRLATVLATFNVRVRFCKTQCNLIRLFHQSCASQHITNAWIKCWIHASCITAHPRRRLERRFPRKRIVPGATSRATLPDLCATWTYTRKCCRSKHSLGRQHAIIERCRPRAGAADRAAGSRMATVQL